MLMTHTKQSDGGQQYPLRGPAAPADAPQKSGTLLTFDSRVSAPGGVALTYNDLFTEGEGSIWEPLRASTLLAISVL